MKKGSFWGKGVWLIYGGFVAFILGCVAIVAVQHIDLVEPDYYEKGLAYQQQINRLEMGKSEGPEVAATADRKGISINFEQPQFSPDFRGTILFFRPSDARMDFEIPLEPNSSGHQDVIDSRLQSGYWRVKISWQTRGESFYSEHQVFIG